MGRAMHGESRFARYAFNPQKYAAFLRRLIPQGLSFAAEKEGEIVGAFIGGLAEHPAVDAYFSYDWLTYVRPKHRGYLGWLLVKRYIHLAQAMGVEDIHIGVSAGIATERTEQMYSALGFTRIGGGYVLNV